MMTPARAIIPDEVLLPPLNAMIKERGTCSTSFVTYDFETIRSECGTDYAGVPLDDLRHQAENLRKGSKTVDVNGHGPAKLTPPPPEYQEYLRSPHWIEFAKTVREFWGYRCALCNIKATGNDGLDVHHRHYDTVHEEKLTDCIALCRGCHKVAHTRIKRRREETPTPELFG